MAGSRPALWESGLLAIVIRALPDWAVFQSPFRQAYSPRVAGFLRMTYYTILLVTLAHIRWTTGGTSAHLPRPALAVPLETSFMFFMFLRDIYQHSNADDGRLTNSAGLLYRPLHALGCICVWTGYAHTASSLSGSPALSTAKPP